MVPFFAGSGLIALVITETEPDTGVGGGVLVRVIDGSGLSFGFGVGSSLLEIALSRICSISEPRVVATDFGIEFCCSASAGICGLLGALAGVAIATMAAASDSRERRPAWQTLGALAALFGMIVGVAPGSDHYAHVGGVLSGVVLGRFFGVRARPPVEVAA